MIYDKDKRTLFDPATGCRLWWLDVHVSKIYHAIELAGNVYRVAYNLVFDASNSSKDHSGILTHAKVFSVMQLLDWPEKVDGPFNGDIDEDGYPLWGYHYKGRTKKIVDLPDAEQIRKMLRGFHDARDGTGESLSIVFNTPKV